MSGKNLLAGVSREQLDKEARAIINQQSGSPAAGGRNLLANEDRTKLDREAEAIQRKAEERRNRPQVRGASSFFDKDKPTQETAQEREEYLAQNRKRVPTGQIETDGYLDQQRVKIGQMGAGLLAGGARAIVALGDKMQRNVGEAPGDQFVRNTLRDFAEDAEIASGRRVEGTTTFDEVKQNPFLAPKFIIDEGPASLAISPLLMNPWTAGAVGLGMTGQIAQERAVNDGRTEATAGDVGIAAPFAAGSLALDRLGFERLLKPGTGGLGMRIAKAGGAEALTEGVQGAIENLGGSLGTVRGVDAGELADNVAAGALVGGGVGVGFRGGAELVDGTGRLMRRNPNDQRAPAPGNIERAVEAASTPTQGDIDSAFDTSDIAEGKAEIAKAKAEHATEKELGSIGMPNIGERVTITDPELGTQTGTMRDRFTGPDGSGVVIELDDGKIMREFDDTLADLGISITAEQQQSALPDLYHGGRAGMSLDDIQIVRGEGATKQGKKGRVYGGFYATDQVSEAEGYADMAEGSTVYKLDLKPDAVVEQKQGDITRLSPQVIEEYRARGVDVVVGKDPRGRTEYAIINRDAIAGMTDTRSPTAEADALDAQLAAQAQAALQSPAAPPAAVDAPPSPPAGDGGAPITATGKRGEVAEVLRNAGFTPAVVAGFLGNFEVEGGYDGARGDGGSASGIAQWRLDRRDKFRQIYGKEPHEATAAEQAEFVVWEMRTPRAAGMTVEQRDQILAAKSPEEAAELIDRFYERSDGKSMTRRAKEAAKFAGDMPVGDATTAPVGEAPAAEDGGRSRASMLDAPAPEIADTPQRDVDIEGDSTPDAQAPAAPANVDNRRPAEERAERPVQPGTIQQMPGNRTNKEYQGQGWNAAESGWSIEDNPYLATSTAAENWDKGFRSSAQILPKGAATGSQPAGSPQAAPVAQAPAVERGTAPAQEAAPAGNLGKVTFADSSSGKGLIVSGLSDAQAEILRTTVPQAKAAPMSGGRVTYSKKHEAAIRAALAQDAPSAGGDRLTPAERARFEELQADNAEGLLGSDAMNEYLALAAKAAQEPRKPGQQGPTRTVSVEEMAAEERKGKKSYLGLPESRGGAKPGNLPQGGTLAERQWYANSISRDPAVIDALERERQRLEGGNTDAPRMSRDQIADRLAEVLGHTRGDMHNGIADAIHEKDFWLLTSRLAPHNKSSRKVFTEATGVKLPNSKAGTEEALRDWSGITQAEIDRVRGDSATRRADESARREREQTRENAAYERVSYEGQTIDGAQFVDDRIAEGFDRLVNTSRGPVPKYALANANNEGFPIKGAIAQYAKLVTRDDTRRPTDVEEPYVPMTDEEAAASEGMTLDEYREAVAAVEPLFQPPVPSGPRVANNARELQVALEETGTAKAGDKTFTLEDKGNLGWTVNVRREGERVSFTRGGGGFDTWSKGEAIKAALEEAYFPPAADATPAPTRLTREELYPLAREYPNAGNFAMVANRRYGISDADGRAIWQEAHSPAPTPAPTAEAASRPLSGTTEAERSRETWQGMFDAASTRMRDRLDAVNPESLRPMLEAMAERDMRMPDGDLIEMVNPHRAVELGYVELDVDERGNRTGKITEAGRAFVRGETAANAAANAATPGARPAATPSPNTIVTDDRAAEIRRLLAEKINPSRLNAGIDPEILALGAELAVYHLERGARRFIALSKAIAADLGTTPLAIRKYLRVWYNGGRDMMEDEGVSIEGMDTPDTVRALLGSIEDWGDQVTAAPEPATGGNDADLQNGLRQGDAGSGTRDVQPAAPQRGAGGASPQEDQGSARPVQATGERDGAAAGQRGAGERGGREAGDGAGVRNADGVSSDSGRTGGSGNTQPADLATGQDWRIEPGSLGEDRSFAQKARDNIAAIETVKQVEREGRLATPEEQAAIARYVGWGGLKNAFPDTQGNYGKGFETIGPRLRELLTNEEYDTAARSIQYAHYTGETVVRAMWDIAEQLGFRGGSVFEPGMGTGNFVGMMPASLKRASSYAGLEYDHLTASIAKLLYPKSGVRQDDYTRTPAIYDAFDLVIGNPPFSDTAIRSDAELGKFGFLLHDFFFAKSLDAVKPGGLLMFVTSAGTMNKRDNKARKYLAERADLVGAIRLPGNTFERNAGTSVTTDIVILRKRMPGQQSADNTWISTDLVSLPDRDGNQMQGSVNSYFTANPEMILGEQGMFDKLVAGPRYAVRAPAGFDLNAAIREAAKRLPGGIVNTMPQLRNPRAPAAPELAEPYATLLRMANADLPKGFTIEVNPSIRGGADIRLSGPDRVLFNGSMIGTPSPEAIASEFARLVGMANGDPDNMRLGVRYIKAARDAEANAAALPPSDPSLPAPAQDFTSSERKDGSYYLSSDGKLMQFRSGRGVEVQAPGKGVTGGTSKANQEKIRALIPIKDALRRVYAADLKEDTAAGDDARKALGAAYDAFVKKYGPINTTEVSYRRPNRIQIESARAAAREEARLAGREWEDGSFNVEPYLDQQASLAEIARARTEARDAAIARGETWDEGSFDPEDVPDIVIEKRPNLDPFMGDEEGYRLAAIEHYDSDTRTASKGRVFSKSAIKLDKEPEIKSAQDALLYSINRLGRPDVELIAEKASMSRDEVLDQLAGQLFEDPSNAGTYLTRETYLSGDVRIKLSEARKAAERDPAFQRNVTALEAAQPAPLTPSEIAANLGMPWLPTDTIRQFATETLGLDAAKVSYFPKMALWQARGNRGTSAATATWGTERMDAFALLEAALNRQQVVVRDTFFDANGNKQTRVNEVDTQAANDKLQAIKQAFADWVYADQGRADRLVQIYNERFNSLVAPKYDGSYLTTPGINPDWRWRPHQQAVVARIIQTGNTYMAHEVGAGKTSAMIGAGMEMKRLGLVNKPMYVVPNHMLGQFTKEFYEQYPLARIRVADEQRFHTTRRKEFIAQVAVDDLDAIIITHSGFEQIPVSDGFLKRLIDEQIAELEDMLREIGKDQEQRVTRARVQNQKEKLEQRLAGLTSNKRKDKVFTFDEMGVDFLFVDEAHMFRKLDFTTRMGNVKGIDPQGSQMSFDLYAKSRYLEQQKPGRNLVLASGTPITNTMAELYSISRYLQTGELERRGLDHFDGWAGAFGETETKLEEQPGGGYKPVTRFSKFVNVPELSVMVRQVMDVVSATDLRQYVSLPNLKGGSRQMVKVEMTDGQQDYKQVLARRKQAIDARKGPPKAGDDIILSVIGDGRKSAIDMRLIDATAGQEDTKLERMIDEVAARHKEFKRVPLHDPLPGGKGYTEKPVTYGPATQMVFSNFGINGAFPVHKYIKQSLIARGVPANEIALISDFKSHVAKQRLFNDMNEGKVRILIGSVQKMGTGVNAQRRLRAVHNMDPLWYPADDTQRNGRIIRQGNMNPEIEILDYSTEGTYDSNMWGMMARKARFIEGFMRGDPTMRDMEDLGEASTYEQAAALTASDPRVLELTEWKQELDKIQRQKQAFEREKQNVAMRIAQAGEERNRAASLIPLIEQDIATRALPEKDEFTGTIGNQTFDDPAEYGVALLERVDAAVEAAGSSRKAREGVGALAGFNLAIDLRPDYDGKVIREIAILRAGNRESRVQVSSDARGTVTRILNAIGRFERELADAQARQEQAEQEVRDYTPQLEGTYSDNGKAAELREKIDTLEATLQAETQAAEAARAAQAQAEDSGDVVREDGPTFNAVAETGDPAYTDADDAADPQQRNASDPLRGDRDSVPVRERDAGRTGAQGQPDRGGIRVRELGIAAEIQRTGSAALVGREVTAPSELAELAQVYRDPRHETFRVFFMRGNEIVHATGVTARLPDQAPLIAEGGFDDFAQWLMDTKASSGADGYYLLHNHPSGNPTPSPEDTAITRRIAQRVSGFRSHVVINSNRFAFITADGGTKVREQNFGPDALIAPSKPGPLLGKPVGNAEQLAAAAKLAQREGYVTIIGTSKLAVRTVVEVPAHQIERSEKYLMGLLRRIMRKSGSTDLFLVGEGDVVLSDKAGAAFREKLLTEAISTDGRYLSRIEGDRNPLAQRQRDSLFSRTANAQFVAEDGPAFDFSPRPMPERDAAIILAGQDPTWKGKMESAYNEFRRAAQDRYLPLLRVQRDIELRQGAPLPPEMNPYLGEELSAGRIGSRLESLMEDKVRPLFDAMADEKVTTEELETYLYARHAPERNARMQEINPELGPGEGSGMTDLEARAVMARIRNQGKMEAMQRLARRVDEIRDDTVNSQVEYGLISEGQADEWRATYEHYVPLRGFAEGGGDPADAARMNRSGGGINVRGKESKAAFGRRSVADSPLAYLILQAEEAIVRGETNRVAQRFVDMAKANPDDNFWKVNKAQYKKRMNPDTGLVENYLVTQLTAEDKDWTVTAKFDGKERRVTMNRANPEARALADAMRNLTQHQLDFVTKYLGAVNRFLSRVNTSYNPEFVISNAIRDVQTAAFNLTAEDQKGLVGDTVKNYRAALVASTKGAFGNKSGEWGKWYQEFIEDGGRVYFNQVEDVDLIKKRMRRIADQVNGARGAKDVRLQARRYARAAIDTIENVNLGVENAVRLSAYRAARERGMSRERAASLAKNLTVNFNRRGTFGPVANALYLFFNASVQGSVRMFQAVRSKRLQKVLAGVAVSAAVLEIMNAMVSGDDEDGESFYDKIPDYEKRSNLIVMLPDGKSYFKFPLPYGYNVFYGAGRAAAEIARRGGDRWKESAGGLLTTALTSFNPIGFETEGRSGWEAFVSFVTPTVFDPIVDLSQNRDFTGRPIMPERSPYGPGEPEHQRYFGGTGPHWVAIAEYMNLATGGDDVTEGAVSMSPAAMEHLFGTVVGAAGSFIDRTVSVPSKIADPEFDFNVSDVPFARKAVGTAPRWYNKSAYYERIGTVEAAVRDTRDYLDREQFDSARQYAEAKAAVLSLEPAMKESEREMRKIRKARREIEGQYELKKIDKATFDRERGLIRQAEDIVINRFNSAWNASVRSGREFKAGE